jgi:hypothetical protein
VAIGRSEGQARFDDAAVLLGDQLRVGSLYRLLAEHGQRLFGDEYFADVFKSSTRGRPTVPARVIATVMLLQAHEGLSDREACDRLAYDLRWKAAAGLPAGAGSFHPTVLVGMRNRLRASGRPKRLFEDVIATARAAGLLRGRRRVFDSTPLFDAVATQDTVTQLRAAIRRVLGAADQAGARELAAALRAALTREDAYATAGKPPCDWDDPAARDALVDALVGDANAALAVLHGHPDLPEAVLAAGQLLALVAGQDVEQGEDGVFRIARKVARDRVISTVDPEARHGHKSRARTFDGYKAHVSVDPDDELITNVTATPANTPDRDVIDDLLREPGDQTDTSTTPEAGATHPAAETPDAETDRSATTDPAPPREVFGDSAYADGATLDRLTGAGHDVFTKVPPVRNNGGFSKDRFRIDPDAGTATCPAGHTTPIRPARRGGGQANFGGFCGGCPLRQACTRSRTGRVVSIHPHEAALQKAKAAQRDPDRQQTYRQTRPTVERKIAHFTRRPWGGRNARCRGTARILTDVLARASAVNLARLATLGLHTTATGWGTA